jgi:AcrR family transcriptional regulator
MAEAAARSRPHQLSAHPRRERRKQEVRERIITAALELFDQHGFEATKVSDICEAADVVNKTFFNHFPTKQHLLREVAEQQLAVLFDDIRATRERPGTTRERLVWFFERLADNVDTAGPMRRELITELVHAAHGMGKGSEQSRLLHAAFAALVRDGRTAGDVSDAHALITQAELVLGTFYALILSWAHDETYSLRRRALAAARLLGDALCGPEEGKKP